MWTAYKKKSNDLRWAEWPVIVRDLMPYMATAKTFPDAGFTFVMMEAR
jgi:hypothetical protein